MPITNPTDIPGLLAWYDARLETGVVTGDALTQMTDQSGNGNHALADGTPKWASTGGPDGGAHYDFDGTGCFVLPSGILDKTGLPAESVVYNGTTYNGVGAEVVSTIKAGGAGPHWSFSNDGETNYFADPAAPHPTFASIVTDGFGSPRGAASGTSPLRHMMPLPVGDTAWHTYGVSSFGSTNQLGQHRARIDGVVQNYADFLGTGAQQPVFQDEPCIGAPFASSSLMYTGDFGCIMVFERRLTDLERADLYDWLDTSIRVLPAGGTFETAIEIVPVDGAYVSPAQSQFNFATVAKGNVEMNESVWWKYTAAPSETVKLTLDFADTILDGLQSYIPDVNVFVDGVKVNTSNLTIDSGAQTVILDPGTTCTIGIGGGWAGYDNYFTYSNTNPPNNVQYVLSATAEVVTRPDNDSMWLPRDLVFTADEALEILPGAELLTREPGEPGTRPYATAWWKYTPDVDTRLDLNTYLSWPSKWVNLVANTHGNVGTTGTDGWVALTAGATMFKGDGSGSGNSTIAYRHVNSTGVAGQFRTDLLPIPVDTSHIAAQYGVAAGTTGHYVLPSLQWFDISLAPIGSTTDSRTQVARLGRVFGTAVPTGAAYVALQFDLYPDSFSTSAPAAFSFVDLVDVVVSPTTSTSSLTGGLATSVAVYRQDGVGVLTSVTTAASPYGVTWRTGVRAISTLEAGKTYYIQLGNYENETISRGEYVLHAYRTTLPANNLRARATPISFTGGQFTSEVTDSLYLTTESGETGSRTAWWKFTPSTDMVVDFDTALTTGAADLSTRITVFEQLLTESFETGVGAWSSDGHSTVAPTTDAYEGSAAMQISVVDSYETFVNRVDGLPAAATKEYLYSGFFRRPAMDALNTTIFVNASATFFDGVGAELSKTYGSNALNAANTGSWLPFSGGATAPASTATVKLGAYATYTSGRPDLAVQVDSMELLGMVSRGVSTLAGVAFEAGKTYYVQLAQTGTLRALKYVLHAVDTAPVEEQPTEQTIDLVAFTGEGTLSVVNGASVKRTAAFQGVGLLAVVLKPRIIVNLSGSGSLAVTAVRTIVPELTLMILDPIIVSAPGPITVVVANANPDAEVTFSVGGVVIYTTTTDTDGYMAPTSFNLPEELMAGTYVLEVTQGGTLAATDSFAILEDPPVHATNRGPDAQAVEVPGAVYGDRRKWVLQDLMPGGLGSWVMPTSPAESSSPFRERQLNTKTTTAGRHHVVEGAMVPVEWTFSGLAPTEEFADKLQSYVDLNRRCYVIDHRGRAFKVVFIGIDLQPRLRRNYNGVFIDGHDYTVTALVLDQDWVTPA